MSEDDVHHPDGVYGWSLPLSCPGMKAIPLSCDHLNIFKDGEALSQVTATILSLLNTESIGEPRPQNSDPELHSAEQVNILPNIITKY